MAEKRFDWLGKKAKKKQPEMSLVRVLWRMKGTTPHGCQAAIYRVATGLELRITYKGEVQETTLARTGEEQLLMRAEALRQTLLKGGWIELTLRKVQMTLPNSGIPEGHWSGSDATEALHHQGVQRAGVETDRNGDSTDLGNSGPNASHDHWLVPPDLAGSSTLDR